MFSDPEWYNLIKCGSNFYWNFDELKDYTLNNVLFFREVCKVKNEISPTLWRLREQNKREQMLHTLFSEIYELVTMRNPEFTYFLKKSPIYSSTYDACLYSTLCLFLYYSKRRKRISLTQFTYENSLNLFNDEHSVYYCPSNQYSDILNTKTDSIRKVRHRILSNRSVYDHFPQWSILTEDLVYEWNLYNILSETPPPPATETWRLNHGLTTKEFDTIRDTLKRIHNLYNDINNMLKAERSANYIEQSQNAYKKFNAKLKKIKYENYVKLQKVFLSYICENPKYLGILLYRYERQNKPYIITSEIKYLLNCKDDTERRDIIYKSIVLENICFPKLYNDLFKSPPNIDMARTVKEFPHLNFLLDFSVCLILEDFIESEFFEEDWETFFLDTLNTMSKNVFYTPNEIDFSITPKSQEKFMEILSAPIRALFSEELI